MSMKIPQYLAMTAAQFLSVAEKPPHCAWMSCHFSPGGKDLSNLPASLPPDSILILDDQFPPNGHDPERIGLQLTECMQRTNCRGLLLDFQRPSCRETAAIAERLAALPFPVCVSDLYAKPLDVPVFAPACPVNRTLAEHLRPWQGREIWLETAPEICLFTITGDGCRVSPGRPGEFPHKDAALHCRYRLELMDSQARFTLCRQKEDVAAQLADAGALGVTCAVGLYQELTNA